MADYTAFSHRLIDTLCSLISLSYSDELVPKRRSYDPDEDVDGLGVIVMDVTAIEQMNPGLPDYKFTVSVMGITKIDEDPDKSILHGLLADSLNSIRLQWITSTITEALGKNCVGILPASQSTITSDGLNTIFRFDVPFIFIDLSL